VISAGYLQEGKRFATIAIGCTGGKHRSTAMAEEFARRLRAKGVATKVLHRDVGRE
jgi:RNase adapter protein RapZ